ncbi:hypothetical protein XENOCAPTIV_028921 [Xenoophorus captivus]|uniref:Secreted protein n=2 Tax=Goodeidae TaxID=28758 RepID=A0ABV0RE19_9TELE
MSLRSNVLSSSTPTSLIMSSWTLLYAQVYSDAETGRGHPQTVATKWSMKLSNILSASNLTKVSTLGRVRFSSRPLPACFIPLHPTFQNKPIGSMKFEDL